jgi:hypothetical protein
VSAIRYVNAQVPVGDNDALWHQVSSVSLNQVGMEWRVLNDPIGSLLPPKAIHRGVEDHVKAVPDVRHCFHFCFERALHFGIYLRFDSSVSRGLNMTKLLHSQLELIDCVLTQIFVLPS